MGGKSDMKKSIQVKIRNTFAYFVLIALSVIFVFPLYWLVSTAIKPDEQIFVFPPILIPQPPKWDNFIKAINYFPFFRYLFNTLTVCLINVLGVLFSCSLVAYSFSRIKWPGRDLIFLLMLSTIMLPYQVTMIPLFVIFQRIGWTNTFKPLFIGSFFAPAYYSFLLRQFFLTIPFEISEAAKVDGGSEFLIYRSIILPLSKPALATIGLFTFIAHWNDFLGPLIYLHDETKYTLAIGLQSFLREHGAEWALLMAASSLTVFPIIIIFFFAQKTFIQGITLTGIKG